MIDEARLTEMKDAFGPEGFVELFAIFRDETEDIITRLDQAEAEDLFAFLHAVRGSADNMGLPRLSSACREGQARLRRGASVDPDEVSACFRQSTNALADNLGLARPY